MQMPTKQTNRCLYQSDFKSFIEADPYNILGRMHNAYHGKALTTTDEAWLGEIQILKAALMPWKDEPSDIIFEYDIPRLGKRIDVVLLLRGIIFCLEFKVGQKDALQCDIEQVMDYALDLKIFTGIAMTELLYQFLSLPNAVPRPKGLCLRCTTIQYSIRWSRGLPGYSI